MESNNNNIMCESHKLNITNVISNSVGIRGYNSKGARVSNVICKGSPIQITLETLAPFEL